jgi:D-3-phosphoglycerate dehydrogenase
MAQHCALVTAPDLPLTARELLGAGGVALRFMQPPVTEDALLAAFDADDVHALILRGSPPINARVLAAAKSLKVIAKHGAGIDSVDLAAAQRCNVTVCVAAGANAAAVAEHAVAMMLALVRNLPRLDRDVRAGVWENVVYESRDFSSSVIGIVGYGSIGRHAARLVTALGARALVLSRSNPESQAQEIERVASLDDLLPRVDVLSLHCPLTEATRGLIGARELARLQPGAILVNTARGAVVNEPALIEALASGRLAGAGLDTFAKEPLPREHPLLAFPNVICTPHIAGLTRDAKKRVSTITAANVLACLRGERPDPANVVTTA